jgi:hypothetical protein
VNYAIELVLKTGAKEYLLVPLTKTPLSFPSNAAAHRQAEKMRESNNQKPKFILINVVKYPKTKGD